MHTAGARATSLPFPTPSAVAGTLRTMAGSWGQGRDTEEAKRVRKISVRGPLLVQLNPDSTIQEAFVPAPADAALLRLDPLPDPPPKSDDEKEKIDLRFLHPQSQEKDDVLTTPLEGLQLVKMVIKSEQKAETNVPAFWCWDFFKKWLISPHDQQPTFSELGISGPGLDQRVHNGVAPSSFAVGEGARCITQGREYYFLWGIMDLLIIRLALLAAIDDKATLHARLHPFVEALPPDYLPSVESGFSRDLCPDIRDAIIESGYCRVILLTPAHFTVGYKPIWLLQPREGVTPTLRAVAIKHPQHGSGWDLELRRPKVGRRLAPAGSVYWLRLDGTKQQREKWLAGIWMQCVSDTEQDRLDGFGLAAIGTWGGEQSMKIGTFDITPKQEYITKVRRYELITPLFGGGVMPQQADPISIIRATSVRGQLRFWWRATRGGQFVSIEELRKAEEVLWGGATVLDKDGKRQSGGPGLVQVEVEALTKGERYVPYEIDENKNRKRRSRLKRPAYVPEYAAFPLQPTDERAATEYTRKSDEGCHTWCSL